MVKRFAFLASLAAVAAALALPASVAAADPYQVAVKVDYCQRTGGAHGHGYVELKVKAREVGTSGTNYFVVLSEFQGSSGLGFSTQSTWPKETSNVFPNDATNYFHVSDRRHDFTRNEEVVYRIVITVKFKNNAGDVLATRKVVGSTC
jgi:hypothetical protein